MVWGIATAETSAAERRRLLPGWGGSDAQVEDQHGLLRQPIAHGLACIKDRFEHVPDASVAVAGSALGFAGGYAMMQGIFLLRARAPVPSAPTYWANLAREQVYERCYNGCPAALFGADADALLKCPQDACLTSALAVVGNMTCDATQMWYWADRIPPECLAPIGSILHDRAVADVQRHALHHEIWGVVVGFGLAWVGAVAALSLKRSWDRA